MRTYLVFFLALFVFLSFACAEPENISSPSVGESAVGVLEKDEASQKQVQEEEAWQEEDDMLFIEGDVKTEEGSVPAGVAAFSPLPLPVSGKCTAGDEYTIGSVSDLFTNIGDLECIYAAGKEPNEVPLGYSYGYLLSAANTAFWDSIAELGYQGDYVVKTQCGGKELYIGWMSIFGFDMGTAVWKIGTFDFETAAGEYPVGNTKGIIMDFREDFYSLCKAEGNETPFGLQGFSPFNKSPWPISQFVDFSRVVGRDQADGGLITLNKAFITSDTFDAVTVLFYATKNFDPRVMPDFARDGVERLYVPVGPNGETEISYHRGGVEALLQRLDLLSLLTHSRT